MAEFNLTCFAQSGNAYKAALFLELAGADWQPVWINFLEGAHRSPEYTAKTEFARVPLLEHNGKHYSESGLILTHLAEATGKFGGATQDEKDEILRWIMWDNYGFTSTIAPLRFIATFVPEAKQPVGVIPFLQGRLQPCLKVLDARLANRDFVATPGLSIADLSLIGYLYYGEELPFDLAEFPNITAWLARIAALPGFKMPYDLMPKQA
ncbi:MAG: glutathione S-transferase [Paracoccaceae bacterium]|jgi:glutathione S-transferase